MKLRNEIKECKIHGECLHGVYAHNKRISVKTNQPIKYTRCLECAKEQKRIRSLNDEKRNHDREFTRNWYNTHLQECRQKQKKLQEKVRERNLIERTLYVNSFIEQNQDKILFCINFLKSKYTLKDIEQKCLHKKRVNFNDILNTLKSEFAVKTEWHQSALIKYRHKCRETYHTLSNEEKNNIRNEYTQNTNKIITSKFNELLTLI